MKGMKEKEKLISSSEKWTFLFKSKKVLKDINNSGNKNLWESIKEKSTYLCRAMVKVICQSSTDEF